MIRFFWRAFKRLLLAAILLVIVLSVPVGYVELFCRAHPEQTAYQPIIRTPQFQRREANSFLTYPEWHIVYAYEGLAKVLETGDEHAFDYLSSIGGFWTSFCDLNRKANRHGGGDFNTRAAIHTIGASFTFEMAMKALYEESLGRVMAFNRGPEKTPQDLYSAEMAADYAQFLQQVPWYKYDFDAAVGRLWAEPLPDPIRGWERRLALGGEWKAKSAYARIIAGAVAASGEAQLRIRSVVLGMAPDALSAIPDVEVIENNAGGVLIETPRYRAFTNILNKIALTGGDVVEIAGNDDIMVSLVEPEEAVRSPIAMGELVSRLSRDGFDGNRVLVTVRTDELSLFLRVLTGSKRTLEHIYDY